MDSKVIEEILGRLSDQDVKDELRKTTDEVLSYGVRHCIDSVSVLYFVIKFILRLLVHQL